MNITYASLVTPSAPFDSSNLSYTSTVILVAILVLAGTSYTRRAYGSKTKIPALGGLSIVNAQNFFVRRCDFLLSNFQKMGQPIFSFDVMHVSLLF